MAKQSLKPVLEHGTQSEILENLLSRGMFAFRVNTGAYVAEDRFIQYGYPGCADIIAVVRGRFIGIEVKSPRGRQTELQKSFQQNVENSGGIYVLARSWDDVEKKINQIVNNVKS